MSWPTSSETTFFLWTRSSQVAAALRICYSSSVLTKLVRPGLEQVDQKTADLEKIEGVYSDAAEYGNLLYQVTMNPPRGDYQHGRLPC